MHNISIPTCLPRKATASSDMSAGRAGYCLDTHTAKMAAAAFLKGFLEVAISQNVIPSDQMSCERASNTCTQRHEIYKARQGG